MSAAPELNRVPKIQPAQHPAPAPRPVRRPARPRVNIPAVLGLAAAWALLMFLAFSLVQTRMTIRSVEAATAQARREIAQLEEQNQALEAMIANAASVEEVERWALAHGMRPPAGVDGTLEGRDEAVAVRTPAPPADVEPGPAAEPATLWQAWLDRFQSRLGRFAAQ
ncbi:MAG: hypothetical protein DIU55_005510 [Bacillota bacterium]|nr:MAG: hypothetical protein DIU55_12330 [Bacillota bacterium]